MRRPTRFSALVGCDLPVQLAAMGGGVDGPALARAVQDSGGLGMVSWLDELPSRRCGVNFLVPFLPSPDEIGSISGRARVVEFFWGDPVAELVDIARRAGAVVGWQVGSVAEAQAAAQAGCDYLVAQGTEAGGHVRGTELLDDLLSGVVEAVSVPVVAAGGIATAERVAELLASGAEGVRVGTRFLVCPESCAHPEYVQNLLDASGTDTVLTEWFDEGWPHAPHRVLAQAAARAERSGWRQPRPPCQGEPRDVADMAQYAGTGVGRVDSAEPAARVMSDLVRHI